MIMPSETMDLPSFFFTDATFPSERQIGFWKSDSLPDHFATAKSISMAPFESLGAVEHQSARPFELHQSLLTRDQKLIHSLGRHAVGAERVVSQSPTLSRSMVPDPGTRSSLNSQFASKCENSLFSRSLSELFDRKSSFSSNNVSFSQPVDAGASHDEEPFESLEEIEAQTIGNLLPSDEDLFSGMTDKLDNTVKSNGRDDAEELEFFSSVGGLDLEDDVSTAQNDIGFPGIGFNRQLGFGNGAIAGGHSYGEQPSRTLFVRNINSNVEDSELKALFEPYGEIHILYTSCKHRGFVMVSYYDIRAAINAKKELQDISMKRRKLDIHYSIPKDNPSEKDINQGTLVAFDIDASISNDELHQLFGAYGEIKEIHESPNTSHQKFIEFYDVRASQKALRASNRGDFEGKRIKLEPFHPGSSKRLLQQISPELEQDGSGPYTKRGSPPINSTMGFPGSVPRGSTFTIGMDSGTVFGLPSPTQAQFLESPLHHGIAPRIPTTTSPLLRTESVDIAEFVHRQGHILGSPNFHPHSLPEYCDGLKSAVYCCSLGSIAANRSASPHERIDSRLLQGLSPDRNLEFSDGGFSSTVNGGSSLPGHHYSWSNSYHSHSPGGMWPNSPSCVNGIAMAHSPARLHGPPRPPPPVLSCVLPITNHHVGSAPTANSSLWDRRRAYAGESSETSFQPGSLGSLRISSNSMHSMELLSPNLFSPGSGNYTDLSLPPKHNQRSPIFPGRGQMSPRSNSFDSPNERARSRRNEGSIDLADRKQYELDLERIRQGEDNRTTLMIKNIPNKYTSKMLLAAIDEHHKGTYDFIYLPIDFKNKCNVGYAFINMTEPSQIIPFYQAFNGKKWEKFNSEKVASLAYARIQGKAALIAHFQNSSLMNEDKRCRPILFNTDGPNAGEQVSFPMGVNVRTRPGKAKSITLEDLHCGGLPSPVNEDSSPGDSSSGTEKDSD